MLLKQNPRRTIHTLKSSRLHKKMHNDQNPLFIRSVIRGYLEADGYLSIKTFESENGYCTFPFSIPGTPAPVKRKIPAIHIPPQHTLSCHCGTVELQLNLPEGPMALDASQNPAHRNRG